MPTFIRRAPWWLVALWAVTVAALALNAYAGAWVNVACLACIGLLSVYSEALFQQLTDARKERDEASRLAAKLGTRLVDSNLRFYARNPRADWED